MTEIICQYRKPRGDGKHTCQVASDLADVSLDLCEAGDDACRWCLGQDVPPQAPNKATASIAFRACNQAGKKPSAKLTAALQAKPLQITEANTPCVHRGKVIGQKACKPCSAGSLTPVMVDVFSCAQLGKCTLKNTGEAPKIQGCVTCEHRVAEFPKLHALPTPASVLNAMRSGTPNRPSLGTAAPLRQSQSLPGTSPASVQTGSIGSAR
jgi:hypothetical protein